MVEVATLVYARWNPPEGSNLADLEGVWNDLFSARDFSVRLGAAFLVSPYDYTLLDALSTAALTRYARSFTTGVRERLKVHVEDALNVDEKEMHERFMAIDRTPFSVPVPMRVWVRILAPLSVLSEHSSGPRAFPAPQTP